MRSRSMRGLLAAAVCALGVTGALVAGAVAPATSAPRYPVAITKVVARPRSAADQVVVAWRGGGRAKRVAVVAGSKPGLGSHFFASAWAPAGTRTLTLTVPKRYRPFLGAGTGNPVWIKVVQSNGPSAARASSPISVPSRAYRATAAGTWSFAGATPPVEPVTRLRVGAYNVQSIAATRDFSPEFRWPARAPRVARTIEDAELDLLLTSELTTTKTDSCVDHPNSRSDPQPYRCRDHTQLGDLAQRLNGLRLVDHDAYDRAADRRRSGGGAVTVGEHIFVNPDRLRVIRRGFLSPAMAPGDRSVQGVQGLGVARWADSGSPDRWLSWAELQTTDGAKRTFFAVAAHFPTGGAKRIRDARARESAAVRAAIDRLAGDKPVVLGGDLNSDALDTPKAVNLDLVRHGWFDAAAVPAAKRKGARYPTANANGATGKDSGYAAHAQKASSIARRIDYILLRNSPHAYAYRNVLRLDRHGDFVRSHQGSDHNLQLATIGIATR
ncbi:endonuclease/exonuclease/phosphatase family protein [Amnibacterium endophyticum]|uniref:Endonuclease/exonuclease/phosphatase family protein n=1 Tax=Amnibacterium endophyticum TaxID=2109337 RepID=A0ABW4LDM4_9MICO